MLVHSDYNDWIAGITGWVNLLNPDETAQRLDMYKKHPKFRGIRHLIHTEADPDWVVQNVVIESLKVLAAKEIIYEVVAVFPNHLKHVPTLANRVPGLKMVIDHLAKPPYGKPEYNIWADQMKAAAESPNVYAKMSGLNTAVDPSKFGSWTADDIKPGIDYAFKVFGANRLMFGSDWPVAILAGTYQKVWDETNKALAGYSKAEVDTVLGGTAAQFYRLG
jgi:L-fuconolactonase